MLAALAAQQKAAEEGMLPPPPEFVTPIDSVAAATEGVREQQLGMYAEELFTEEDFIAQEAEKLAAQQASFQEEQKRYAEAYAKRGATTDEEKGAILSGEVSSDRIVKLVGLAIVAFVLVKAFS